LKLDQKSIALAPPTTSSANQALRIRHCILLSPGSLPLLHRHNLLHVDKKGYNAVTRRSQPSSSQPMERSDGRASEPLFAVDLAIHRSPRDQTSGPSARNSTPRAISVERIAQTLPQRGPARRHCFRDGNWCQLAPMRRR
jgi:hypothetical protein